MTFSIVMRNPDTGEFGSAISSSSPAVAARCVNLADGAGAVNSQNVTDPRLGHKLIDALKSGVNAVDALDQVVASADQDTIGYRQLLVVDAEGRTAIYSGDNALGTFGHAQQENIAVGGNMLASLDVLDAMVQAAATSTGSTGSTEERLIAAMRAGIAAGGEEGPVHSAGLSVVGSAGWRITDLRVDWTENDPIEELAALVERWLPERDDYVSRGLNPAAAPSYGVPGDE